jgi:hypothetical protein
MEPFLDFVIKALVDRPDAVGITAREQEGSTVFELRVHPMDTGKVIGRQGATINAIRALMQAAGAKKGQRCTLEIAEDPPET